jgi:hypothetical protein
LPTRYTRFTADPSETTGAGKSAAERHAESRERDAKTRSLRIARLEREVFGPWLDTPRNRRPKLSLKGRADP